MQMIFVKEVLEFANPEVCSVDGAILCYCHVPAYVGVSW